MNTSIQQKLVLEGDVRLLERKREHIVEELERIDKQRIIASGELRKIQSEHLRISTVLKEMNAEYISLSKKLQVTRSDITAYAQKEYANINAQKELQERVEKESSRKLKEMTEFLNTQIDAYKTKLLVLEKREQRAHEVLTRYTEEQQALDATKIQVEIMSLEAQQEREDAEKKHKIAQGLLEQAKKELLSVTGYVQGEREKIDEMKRKIQEALVLTEQERVSYSEQKQKFEERHAELNKKEAWITDREQTLKRNLKRYNLNI